MKKLFIASLMFVFAATGTTYALELNSFNVEDEFATAEFAGLDELDATVKAADLETLTYQEIVAKSELNNTFSLKEGISSSAAAGFAFEDMDWAAFAWGFCCCPVGLFVVALNKDKEQEQKMSYWIGVGTNVVLSTISSIVRVAAAG